MVAVRDSKGRNRGCVTVVLRIGRVADCNDTSVSVAVWSNVIECFVFALKRLRSRVDAFEHVLPGKVKWPLNAALKLQSLFCKELRAHRGPVLVEGGFL